jgi:hypothetical protein
MIVLEISSARTLLELVGVEIVIGSVLLFVGTGVSVGFGVLVGLSVGAGVGVSVGLGELFALPFVADAST